jgi:hypothetical protein
MKLFNKKEFSKLVEDLVNEISAFLKVCPICKQKFKDMLDKRTMCLNCERDQKINNVLENE